MEQQDRLHALDAVRAFALLLGIVFHATMSFVPALASVGWPIVDSSPSETLSVTFYVLHIFRMTTFFVMAGFFARLVVHRKGLAAFIADRRRRILVPLLVSWPVQIALITGAVIWAMLRAGKSLETTPPTTGEHILIPFPLTHLWFLYELLLLYAVVLGFRLLANSTFDKSGAIRGFVDRTIALLTQTRIAPVFLAIPVAISLYATEWWNFWIGIPTPDNSLIPNLAAFVGYGTALTFGWFLHRQMHLLKTLERQWPIYLAVAVALTVLCYSMVGMPTAPVELDSTQRAVYAGAYGVAIWSWTFAVIGVAMKYLSGESKVRRYLADSSYWMYIMHLPIVFALQGLMMQWPLHWTVKIALILVITFMALLVTYHYWVRSTFIGERLNGKRFPRSGVQPEAASRGIETPTDDDSVLASLSKAQKSYGDIKALHGIDLDVRRGELLAVLGPNGAGKSTAIALLLGLQQPNSGSALLFGRSPLDIEARRQVGIMMQEVTLAPELKVREHVDLVASYYPAPLSVQDALRQVGVESLAERPYRQLSGGQKRQVQFAMAICGRPKLLFLDEPTVGLDIRAREAMWQTIRSLIAQGCSIVLTTHYLEEAEALADRVVVVNKGKVIASGTVAEMRSIVARKRISCVTTFPRTELATWDGVEGIEESQGRMSITTSNAESLVRRLLASDSQLAELEVRRAGLSEAFSELTQEAAQ